jgi:CRISPR/Cas system CMR-associated protein Cmr5 small subunit
MLARRQVLQPAKKEFDQIDKHLKAKLIKGQDLIAGDYTLTWKEVKKKEFTVKAQTSWRMNVVDNLE